MICVTGASGFIGQRLVKRLLQNSLKVRALNRSNSSLLANKSYFFGDLSNNKSLDGFLTDATIIYHCAGEVKNTSLMYKTHVDGTRLLLNEVNAQIQSTNKPIHWVQLSSVGAYGKSLKNISEIRQVTESSTCNPLGEYEITKTLSDELVIKFADSQPLFSYTILRPTNVVGPNMSNQSFISLLKIIRKRIFFYIGHRCSIANYVHVDDVIEALILCGHNKQARNQIFILSNDCKLSDIVQSVSLSLGLSTNKLCFSEKFMRLLVKFIPSFFRHPLSQTRIDALVSRTLYSNSKIKDLLEFSPQYSIPEFSVNLMNESCGR